MSYLDQITSPTLLLDEKICRANLQKMADKAKRHGMQLIPHFKTAQSHKIGNWAKEYGITEITTSSIKMAEYLSGQGWERIHIAFPFNPLEADRLNEIASSQGMSVQLINTETAQKLADTLTNPVSFFIEIDAGYGRTGVDSKDYLGIQKILDIAKSSTNLNFRGFYLHPGHTYYGDIPSIYEETREALSRLKKEFKSQYPDLVTRTGDTPGCSVVEDFGDIDQLGPGNFVFYDLMQAYLGSCSKSDIAVAMAVPVVDIKKDRKEILVHGGGVHFAKDVLSREDGGKNFGELVYLNDDGWVIPEDGSHLKSISQEHGVLKASDELLNKVKVGDVLGILPIHSCMTADCMGAYLTLDGKWVDHAEGSKN